MSKLNAIGNGFVQVENTLYNLKNYLTVEQYTFGYDEDQVSSYGIKLTPPHPDKESYENGGNGSFLLTTYSEEEKEQWEEDFTLATAVLEEKQRRVYSFTILDEVTQPNYTIKTPFQFDGDTISVYMDGKRQFFGDDFNYLSNTEIVIRYPFEANTKFIIEY